MRSRNAGIVEDHVVGGAAPDGRAGLDDGEAAALPRELGRGKVLHLGASAQRATVQAVRVIPPELHATRMAKHRTRPFYAGPANGKRVFDPPPFGGGSYFHHSSSLDLALFRTTPATPPTIAPPARAAPPMMSASSPI